MASLKLARLVYLFQRLATDFQLVVCPNTKEEMLCSQLVPDAVVLPGLNLAQYAAVLQKASGVIANDSGPMHLASFVSPWVIVFLVQVIQSEPRRGMVHILDVRQVASGRRCRKRSTKVLPEQ